MILGAIADDFTGASDLASNFAEAGMNVIQFLGVPESFESVARADAVVIALKTRSVHCDEAVRQSLAALGSLQAMGARRFYFKYSSTFDSTNAGNIGQVAEALLTALNATQTIFCPAYPDYARTVYQGHLFVGDRLLSESGMESHPLTPMKDANLVRVLSNQTRLHVISASFELIQQGSRPFQEFLQLPATKERRFIIVDAINNQDLRTIAMACAEMPLVTGSSRLAMAIPDVYRSKGLLSQERSIPFMPAIAGRTAILSGSCSKATQEQVAYMHSRCASFRLDARRCISHPEKVVGEALDWVRNQNAEMPILLFSTATADKVSCLQEEFSREVAATAVESVFSAIAVRMVSECGVRRLIVAGGETSGAVLSGLNVRALRIGPRIDIGVPWTESIGERPMAFALKSGNFGTLDFFQKALEMLK